MLVDSDPQGSLSINLGYPPSDDLPGTLTTVMGNIMSENPYVSRRKESYTTRKALTLMPANIELSGIEMRLYSPFNDSYAICKFMGIDFMEDRF